VLQLVSGGDLSVQRQAEELVKTLFNMGQLWSPEHQGRLKELFDSGVKLEDMCRELGRTPSAIVGKLMQLGRLQVGRGNHYYPAPEDAWCLWPEVRDLDRKLKEEG